MLNYYLHERLLATFKSVAIYNANQPCKYSIINNKLVIEHYGESYAVNCPFCTDKRKRLVIPHVWMTTIENHLIKFAPKCFNETNCLSNLENLEKLIALVYEGDGVVEMGIRNFVDNFTNLQASSEPKLNNIQLPGYCERIDKLDRTHPAVYYVISRGYEPDFLGKEYDVRVCLKSNDDDKKFFENQLIIPVYFNNNLIGYQVRLIITNHHTKYYSFFPKSKVLYALDKCTNKSFVIVCEGVFDVWKFKNQAVCTFGTSISRNQLELLKDFENIYILFDKDMYDGGKHQKKFIKILESVQQALPNNNILVAKLPFSEDPSVASKSELIFALRNASLINKIKNYQIKKSDWPVQLRSIYAIQNPTLC